MLIASKKKCFNKKLHAISFIFVYKALYKSLNQEKVQNI